MKKNYSKPEIVFESFKMTSSIANPCADGFQTNSSSLDSCEYVHNNVNVFGTQNGDCLIKQDEATCYDVPVAGIVLFNS